MPPRKTLPKTRAKPKQTSRAYVLTDDILDKIRFMSRLFYTQQQMQIELGICHTTWAKLKKKDDRIERAMQRGELDTYHVAAATVVKAASNGNLSAAGLLLRTKFKWAPASQSTVVNVTPEVKPLPDSLGSDPIEASRIYQDLIK
jgi:hypothetical protein